MNNDYENLDEELENNNLSEEIDEQSESDYQNQLDNNDIGEQDTPYTSNQPNNQYSSNPMKELAKSTATTGATAIGANAYNKFSRTSLGRNLISKGQNTLNALNQSNNPLAKLAANKVNRMVNPLRGISNNNPTSTSAQVSDSNPLQKKDDLPNKESLGEQKHGLNNLLKSKGNTKNALSGLIGDKKGGAASFLGKKKFLLLKLKIIGVLLGILAILFIFLFIWFEIDGDEQKILEMTKWTIEDKPSQNGSFDSLDDYLNNDHEILSKSLMAAVGYDEINYLSDRIKNVNTGRCNGFNVVSVLVTLIDGMGKLGYKLPYGTPSNEYKIIDPDWGKTIDNNVIGLNEYSLIDWALTTAGINNPVTSIEGYNERDKQIDLVYSHMGDLVINNNKGYIVLGSTGEKITLAYIDEAGLTYKVFTYQELANYTVIDMGSYYSANCKN